MNSPYFFLFLLCVVFNYHSHLFIKHMFNNMEYKGRANALNICLVVCTVM